MRMRVVASVVRSVVPSSSVSMLMSVVILSFSVTLTVTEFVLVTVSLSSAILSSLFVSAVSVLREVES